MNKGLLSQDDYDLRMLGILFITDLWISIFIIILYHMQKNRPLTF